MAKILIVDDEDGVRNVLKRLLGGKGHECFEASNTIHARELLKKQSFDLLLSDIRMPGESGLSLVQEVSRDSPDLAVIMVTAVDDPVVASDVLKTGAYGYLVKPFQQNQILISVINALKRQELERNAGRYRERLEESVCERTAQLEKANAQLREAYQDLRCAQINVAQQEKMASIGQLAAGVAHEINNPIGFISSNLKTLEGYLKDLFGLLSIYRKLVGAYMEGEGKPVPETLRQAAEKVRALELEVDIDAVMNDIPNLLNESEEGTERIKRIVVDLKNFAHPGSSELVYADINKNLDSTLNIAWNELKYKAKITKEYGRLPEIQCYPHQLNQVFMNLLVNAAQAIEKQGEIRITTKEENDHVVVAISDTGVGIPRENLANVFEPFFTTKEVGKGTGLGLNVVYNIIKKHKGTIHVESTPGKGTIFTIELPINLQRHGFGQPFPDRSGRPTVHPQTLAPASQEGVPE